jgi:phosphatidylethanolamine N-methyltransferase
MVSQLFDPTKPKVALDLIVVVALGSLILLFYILPKSFRVPVFAVTFLFWRMCYNFGIGWLLHNQSHHKRLVNWAKKLKIFEHPDRGGNAYPALFKFLKRDMETMIKKDYVFEDAPVEYNTWLIFRRVVDLILMSDFTSYCLFAIANTHIPAKEHILMTFARFIGGIALVLFNLWVKLDAHRVVKDYAWFWGDFFFLVDQELTFDGVFMMCPHPMYSIGYVGFYGIALMAASYNVLFVSIIAHAAQLTFLTIVENPHIDRTYNAPPPKKRLERAPDSPPASLKDHHRRTSVAGHVNDYPPLATSTQPSPVHNIIGIRNLDLLRVTDIAVVIMQVYMYSVALLTPTTWLWQTLFVFNAVVWRLWYTVGLGFILDRQAHSKWWTRHFVKYGESTEEAWRQWKGMYHISMVMCYTSFICAAWKMYGLPPDWEYGTALLRHVIGFGLIALQMWTSNSVYESLGEFGWFFGDFFFDHAPKLTYSGIYRYLNNPERTLGLAGVWGFAIITWSKSIFFLALLSHSLMLLFIQFVEKPHMQKLYHAGLRQQSGVSESLQRSLPTNIKKWTGSVDKVFDDTLDSLEEFIEASGPKLAAGFNTFIKDSTTLFKQFPARVSITRLSPELAGYDSKDYSIAIDPMQSAANQSEVQYGNRERDPTHSAAKGGDSLGRLVVPFGTPIRAKWTAPLNHSKKDWIGLYMVGDNISREVTSVRSAGRWIGTHPEPWENSKAREGILVVDQRVSGSTRKDGEVTDFLAGEVEFSGDKLWWAEGTYELRYHHDGRYNVTAISIPFEVKVARFDESIPSNLDEYKEGLSRPAVEEAILPILQDCFERDPDVAPQTVDEHFGSIIARDNKYARRVVYAVRSMFGIEFAPDVVQADGNVRNLAWRICNAKKVLAPYSMTETNIPTTP